VSAELAFYAISADTGDAPCRFVERRARIAFVTLRESDRFLAARAERQHGLLSRHDVDAAGLDAAFGVAPALLGDAMDSAIPRGNSSPTLPARRLAELRGPGRHGVRTIDRLTLDIGGHTQLERRFLQLMRVNGLPRPTRHVTHRRDGLTVEREDFEFVPFPVVVEVSGRRGHVTETDRLCDARRRNELLEAGMKVIELRGTRS
jgi:hypothetical protein